jgi:hypothetical protein
MVQAWLDEIKPVPARDLQMVLRGRAQFLGRAVSASESRRHKGWNSIFRKEQYAMNMIISILVIAGLLFGGGATVSAAQDDLPNEPLYAVKVWSEDLSLQVQNNPEAKLDRLMELAQTRIQEMTQLVNAGQALPDQVQLRLEQHIQQALQICSNLEDAALNQTLLQLRDRLQQQDRDMERLQIHANQDAQPILERTRTMIQERLRLVDDGLLNHEMFRYAVQNGFRYGQEEDLTPPVQNKQQNGQPISPNTNPGGPNTDQNGTSTGPGEPNPNPGGPGTGTGGGTNPGGTSTGPGGNNNDSGSGSGGGGSGGSGSGGNGK